MARPLVSDELWELFEPLIPKVPRRHRFPGRKRIEDRKVLTGILFVLQTGIPWEYLPQEMGCGSGMTCWRRLREWQQAGVWQQLHELLLAKRAAPSEEARATDHRSSDRLEQKRPRACLGAGAVSRDTNMSPPTAAIRPERAKTMIRIREILIPARRDASAFPPIAKT